LALPGALPQECLQLLGRVFGSGVQEVCCSVSLTILDLGINFEIRNFESSKFIFLFLDYFSYSASLGFPYEL
jgi:hypothetical protein